MLSCTIRLNPYENDLLMEAVVALRKRKIKVAVGTGLLEWSGELRYLDALLRKGQRNKDRFGD